VRARIKAALEARLNTYADKPVCEQPGGKVLAGPMHEQKDILFADIDVEVARRSRKALDVAGHYARPDLFRLEVDRSAKPPVSFLS
jgi:nitrilase